jgi:5-methylcytosine-specific restriction endonuclease McrA
MGLRSKPGRWALLDRRWPGVRLQALRRDGFRCQHCNDWKHLEVHHVRPVAQAPELAFDVGNLLTLCRTCHTDETNRELGHKPDPARRAWRGAVAELATETNRAKETPCLIL